MSIRIDRWLAVRLAAPWERLKPENDSLLPVLMYHSISTDAEQGVGPYYRIVTSPARFRAQIEILRQGNYRTCSTIESGLTITGSTPQAARPVLITFDDGYADFYRNAYPAVSEQGFTATMYLPTAYIGDQRRSFNGRECMTWSEVRELSACGVEFGSHTVTHPKLHQLPRASILDELSRSKQEIEDQTGTLVNSFAYPYAFPQADAEFVQRFRDMVAATGYRTCVTTAIGRASRRLDLLSIKRLPINEDDDAALFLAKLDGGYDWMAGLQRTLKIAKRLTDRKRSSAISA